MKICSMGMEYSEKDLQKMVSHLIECKMTDSVKVELSPKNGWQAVIDAYRMHVIEYHDDEE